jgi:hypothetical protein
MTGKKVKQYKWFIIAEMDGSNYNYNVFIKEDFSGPAKYWYPEWEADSLQECIDFIDSY